MSILFRNKYNLFYFLLILSIMLFRFNNLSNKEISWDIFGYYLPLPAAFIYDDPLLEKRDWVENLNKDKKYSDTLYQISSTPENEPMYFFLFGMSFFYFIFFWIGHWSAGIFGFAQDGFSEPYQYSLIFGGILFTIIGLFYLRKVLRFYFSEKISMLILFVLVVGTNYAHHMTIKNLETVNVLFMLVAIMLWNTIQWHEYHKFKNLLFTGFSVGMMALVKPSEVLMIFVPLLWNVRISFESIKDKISLIFKQWKQFLFVGLIVLLIVSPQLIYWYTRTGHFIYDSYKNPGIGLDLRHPHLLESLFSYRKGWLIYTPVMIFFIAGFYFLFKRNRSIFYALFLPFLLSFYIVTCWTEWWYGAGFSNRPVITYYPLLCIPFGYLLMEIQRFRPSFKIVLGSVIIFFIFLNQFQWWQLRNYILDNYLMTKEYYWKTFLKSSVTDKDKELLMIERNFSGINKFKNRDKYSSSVIFEENFNNLADGSIRTNPIDEFYPLLEMEYHKLTSKDHVWIELSFDLKFMDSTKTNGIFFCTTMERLEGVYGYLPVELDSLKSLDGRIILNYLTPEIRNNKDRYKCYFWNRDRVNVRIDNFKVVKYESKK